MYLLLEATHVPVPVLYSAKIIFTALSYSPSWAPPGPEDFVYPVLKNMPTLAPQGTYVHILEGCCVAVLMGKKASVLTG